MSTFEDHFEADFEDHFEADFEGDLEVNLEGDFLFFSTDFHSFSPGPLSVKNPRFFLVYYI